MSYQFLLNRAQPYKDRRDMQMQSLASFVLFMLFSNLLAASKVPDDVETIEGQSEVIALGVSTFGTFTVFSLYLVAATILDARDRYDSLRGAAVATRATAQRLARQLGLRRI